MSPAAGFLGDHDFALSFLSRCAEDGLSPGQAFERVKAAAALDFEIASEFGRFFDALPDLLAAGEKRALNFTPLVRPFTTNVATGAVKAVDDVATCSNDRGDDHRR